MIQGLFDNGSMPVLERMLQFTEKRHKVLANNIANFTNPFYKSKDMDPGRFQATLRRAIDDRRSRRGSDSGAVHFRDADGIKFKKDKLEVEVTQLNEGMLAHDHTNVNLEKTMQRLAENTLAYNLTVELVRNQFDTMKMAIRERV
jgi:flagellar basal-body rod protein FlgB